MTKKGVSKKIKSKAIARYRSGEAASEIARSLDLNRSTMYGWFCQEDIEANAAHHDAVKQQKAVRLYEEGASFSEVCRLMRCSRTNLAAWLADCPQFEEEYEAKALSVDPRKGRVDTSFSQLDLDRVQISGTAFLGEGVQVTTSEMLSDWDLDVDEWQPVPGKFKLDRVEQKRKDPAAPVIWKTKYSAEMERIVKTNPFSELPSVSENVKAFTNAKLERVEDETVYHIVIPDTQVRAGDATDHLLWAGQYIKENYQNKKCKIIHLGDHWDMEAVSSHDGPLSKQNRRISSDFESGNRAFAVLEESMGTDPLWQKHFLFGNHEIRINRYVETHPELEGFISLDNCVTPDGWQRHDFLEPVEVDGIVYSHYFYQPNTGRPYGGENIEGRIKSVGHSFVMGHQQGLRMGMFYAAGRQRFGMAAGSFYQHDEGYKGPQGNDHWRGIVVLNDVREGACDPMPVSLDYLCRRYTGHSIDVHEGIEV